MYSYKSEDPTTYLDAYPVLFNVETDPGVPQDTFVSGSRD